MRPLLSLLLAAAPTLALADTCTVPEGEGRTINHANLFIEDNAGDGDIGVHGYFDDEAWTELCVFDPEGALILHVRPEGRMGALGISGIFFESNEPGYDALDLEGLKADWPEGRYGLRAAGDGEVLTGSALFTTVLPAMPVILAPATVPEADDPAVPVVPLADLEVEWEPVTASQDGRPVVIRGYQVWINRDDYVDDNGFSTPNFDVHVNAGVTSFVVPASFLEPGALYEIEVVAIEESGNQTIGGASFFRTE